MTSNMVCELVTAHRTLIAVGELHEELIERTGFLVVDEARDGHRLAGEHRAVADLPPVRRLLVQSAAPLTRRGVAGPDP